jgi:hypothetical protein
MKKTNLNKLIVCGNLYDEKNEFLSAGRIYGRGGYAPSLGASHFATEKYTVKKYKDRRNDK